MGYSKSTPVRKLPQFENSDKPTWLGDVNETNRLLEAELNAMSNRIGTLEGQMAAALARIAALEAI
jgi:hypothetical protein